jgi:DNA-binding MarR family transcriptional regulator
MPAGPIPPTPEFLSQLRRTYQSVRKRLDEALEGCGLTTPQIIALAQLESRGEMSSSDLAREDLVSAQSMNVLVTALEVRGLVERRRHPGHGRILLVGLTEAGRAALAAGRKEAIELDQRLLAELGKDERVRLLASLAAVERASAIPKPENQS